MPSVQTLLYKDSSELNELAREKDLSGRGSMTKAEKIEALSDEALSEGGTEILRAKKSALIPLAKEAGIESPYSKTKAELQELLIGEEIQENGTANASSSGDPTETPSLSSNGTSERVGSFPPSEVDGTERAPQAGLKSHFENAEERMNAVREAAHTAMDRSLDEGAKYVVVESFRPKDRTQPIKIQPSYHKRHPDTIVVAEADMSQLAFPLETADPNPVFRSSQ